MTREEAVNWIINISADIGKTEHRDLWHYEQALSEIRELLESSQPEPCDDAVSRIEVRHALCKAVHKDEQSTPCENQTASCLWSGTRVCDYVREIDKLPSVTPKMRTGKWIIAGSEDGYWYKCSECGREFDWGDHFCRECGAKMEEGDE